MASRSDPPAAFSEASAEAAAAEPQAASETARGSRLWLSGLVAAATAGAALRLLGLHVQRPFGDELHAVRVVARHPLRTILTTWFESDPSPPLAALYELLVWTGVELDETLLRLPSLLSGLSALIAMPLLLRSRAPRLTLPLAWLVALSPGFVFYSRIARPYMPVMLLGFVATVAFLRWWRRPGVGAGALYVAPGVLSCWLFVGAAPFVATPFVFAALLKALRPREGPSLRAIAVLGASFATGLALFLVPSWESFLELLRTKPAGAAPPPAAMLDALQLLAGTRTAAPAILFWLLAFAGLVAVAVRDPAFALLSALATTVQLAAMWLLAPVGIGNPVVFGRYLLVALPLVLCWVAAGLVELGDRSRSRVGPTAARVAPAIAVVALFLAGPLVEPARWSSFGVSGESLAFHAPRSRLPPESVPEIYRRLGASKEPGAVLEYTGSPTWNHLDHLVVYQEIHRRRVLFAPQDEDTLFAPGIELRNLVRPRPAALRAAPARYLVVHRDTARELDRLQVSRLGRTPFGPEYRERARLMGSRMARNLERRWGQPLYSDDDVAVWDLDVVRAGRSRRETGSPRADLR